MDRLIFINIIQVAFISVIMSPSGSHGVEVVSVEAGNTLILDCGPTSRSETGGNTSSTSAADSDVTWFLNEIPVSNASQLRLPDIDHIIHHGSDVTCVSSRDLVVVRRIHVQQNTDDVAISVGETMTLNCTLPLSSPYNKNLASWYLGGALVSGGKMTSADNATLQLTLVNASLDQAGNYSCISQEGLTIKTYNVRIGLFPMAPDRVECSGHTDGDFQCGWSRIPDTHLPTNVTFEYYPTRGRRRHWRECPYYDIDSCIFKSIGGVFVFLLNITNALGTISVDVPEYSAAGDWIPYPPNDLEIEALSPSELKWKWNIPDGFDDNDHGLIKYRAEITNDFNNNTDYIQPLDGSEHIEKSMKYANTEYCVRMQSQSITHSTLNLDIWGTWSEQVCATAPPTKPQLDINLSRHHSDSPSKDKNHLRNVTLHWTVKQKDARRYPYQGLDGFRLDVLSKDDRDNLTKAFIYHLNDTFKTDMIDTMFSYTIPGLRKDAVYDVSLSAFNMKGSSHSSATVTIPEYPEPANAIPIIVSFSVLGCLLIIALLAFGFQRLKNNSKPLPDPVFHGEKLKNIRPIQKEREVFDEPPSILKEQQRRLLVKRSFENSGKPVDGTNRHSSGSSSSGIGSDVPCDIIEKEPLLRAKTPSGVNSKSRSSTPNNNPYARLSAILPGIHGAPEAPLAEVEDTTGETAEEDQCTCFSPDEGISLGESSRYIQMEGVTRGYVQPYFTMPTSSYTPNTGTTDPNSHLSTPANDVHLNNVVASLKKNVGRKSRDPTRHNSGDADDEWSLPSSPATPHSGCYSYLASSSTKRDVDEAPPPGPEEKLGNDDYVVQSMLPRISEAQSQHDDIGFESQDQYVAIMQVTNTCPKATGNDSTVGNSIVHSEDSGYIEKRKVGHGFVGNAFVDDGYVDNTCVDLMNNPHKAVKVQCRTPSPQSSPEHAVIVFSRKPGDLDGNPVSSTKRPPSFLSRPPAHDGYVENATSNVVCCSALTAGYHPVESVQGAKTPIGHFSLNQGGGCIVEVPNSASGRQSTSYQENKFLGMSQGQDSGYISQYHLNQMKI